MSAKRTNQAVPSAWPVAGHGRIVEYLRQSIDRDAVAHAYLFIGPSSIGKQTVAEHFAAGIRPVSLVGIHERTAHYPGFTIKVGSIGSVCTRF